MIYQQELMIFINFTKQYDKLKHFNYKLFLLYRKGQQNFNNLSQLLWKRLYLRIFLNFIGSNVIIFLLSCVISHTDLHLRVHIQE